MSLSAPAWLRRCFFAAGAFVYAQAETHAGIVTFNGMPVPGASVTASRGETICTTMTDTQGYYTLTTLTLGMWTVGVSMPGFAEMRREVIVAHDGPPVAWPLQMLPAKAFSAGSPDFRPTANQTSAALNNVVSAHGPARNPHAQTLSMAEATAFVNRPTSAIRKPDSASLDTDETNRYATEDLVINGSTSNAAVSTFSQPTAFWQQS